MYLLEPGRRNTRIRKEFIYTVPSGVALLLKEPVAGYPNEPLVYSKGAGSMNGPGRAQYGQQKGEEPVGVDGRELDGTT